MFRQALGNIKFNQRFKMTNTARLQTLVNHLKTIDPNTFDVTNWRGKGTACAIGHAADIEEFKELGFALSPARGSTPTYRNFQGYEAVMCFFGLEWEDCDYLFTSCIPYPRHKGQVWEVIRRLQNHIDRGQCCK